MSEQKDFEQMHLIIDEIGRGIVYLRTDGVYNFEVLEGLFRKHGFDPKDITDKLDPFKENLGLSYSQLEQSLIAARRMGRLIEGTKEPLFESEDVAMNEVSWLESLFKRPLYEHIQHWHEWLEILASYQEQRRGSLEIEIRAGWKLKYNKEERRIQILSREGGQFLSLLGPSLGYMQFKDCAKPFFDIYNGSDRIQGITSYEEARRLFTEKFGIVPPTEAEIKNAIKSYDIFEVELIESVDGEEGKFYMVNTFVPRIDGARILGPMNATRLQTQSTFYKELLSRETPESPRSSNVLAYQFSSGKFRRVNV